MKKISLIIFLFCFALVQAQNPEIVNHLNLKDKVAIQGYDPVAYFDDKALEGKKEISATHNAAIYYFISKGNRSVFLKNPEKYKPQYGGWCAYAMGLNGKKVSINPETYKIENGKLYLFYDAFFNNTLKDWNKDEERLKAKANENWENLISQ